jgi:hypothetical protein
VIVAGTPAGSVRRLWDPVPGLAPLAMASSHVVTTKATMTAAAAAASIHHQAEIGRRHAGLAPSCSRRLLGELHGEYHLAAMMSVAGVQAWVSDVVGSSARR